MKKSKLLSGLALAGLLTLTSCNISNLIPNKGSSSASESSASSSSISAETSTSSSSLESSTSSVPTSSSSTTQGSSSSTASSSKPITSSSSAAGSSTTSAPTSSPSTTQSSSSTSSSSSTPTTSSTSSSTSSSSSTSKTAVTGNTGSSNGITILNKYEGNEVFAMEFKALDGKTNPSDYKAYFKKSNASKWTKLNGSEISDLASDASTTDTPLSDGIEGYKNGVITINNNIVRIDYIGLSSAAYDFCVQVKGDSSKFANTGTMTISKNDRSGYAHFKNTNGVGAYTNDGLLKDNTQIIYVSNANKNTVTATLNNKTYTGLVSILQNKAKDSKPLDIRVIDSIKTNQWKEKKTAPRLTDNTNLQLDTYWENELETTYGENLVGLTVKLTDNYKQKSYSWTQTKTGLSSMTEGNSSRKPTTYTNTEYSSITGKEVYDDDSYNNMLDVSNASDITLEGIGLYAEAYQWGFTWSSCNSIEVKNMKFTSYTEDACSFGGNVLSNGYYWVHNNTFNKGKNNWDVAGERDKPAGDGAFDLSSVHNVTLSYNQFNSCKKTGLVGGKDSMLNMNITFHHNYYNQVGSRLPLGRQANMHIYNNYYYKCGTAQDIRANAFVLSESNYFDGTTNPQKAQSNAVIKSYNDVLTSCGTSQATKVTDRTASLSGSCKPDGSTNYTNFDTNSSLFYYDSTNKKSDVSILNDASTLPTYVPAHSGVGSIYKSVDLIDFEIDDGPSADATVTAITVENAPKTIDLGTELDLSSLIVKAVYSDGKSKTVTDYTTNAATVVNKNTAGTYTITVTYGTFTKDFTVTYTAQRSWQTVFSDDFSTAETVTKTANVPTEAGIYYTLTDNKDATDINKIEVSDGKLNIVDESDSSNGSISTAGYYIFNESYNSGIVRYTVEFTPTTSNSKWTPIAFLDGGTNINVRTDTSKYLGYSLTGGDDVTKILSSTITSGTKYTIVLTIDYENNTVKLSINDTEKTITGWTPAEISGISFITSSGNKRTYSVDNIKIERYE